jgi:hypothetical protein
LLHGQQLSGDRRAEQHTGDGVEQPDQSHGTHGQMPQASEPSGEGKRGGDQGDVREGKEHRHGERGWRALNGSGDREQEQTSGDELPGGRCEQVGTGAPSFGEEVTEGRHQYGRQGGEDSRHADPLHPRKEHEAYPAEPDHGPRKVRGPGLL